MDMLDFSFFLIMRHDGKDYKDPTVRVTKNKPAVARDERMIKVKMSVPKAVFRTPELVASITIDDDSAPAAIEADVQHQIADILSEAVGLDIQLNISSEPD